MRYINLQFTYLLTYLLTLVLNDYYMSIDCVILGRMVLNIRVNLRQCSIVSCVIWVTPCPGRAGAGLKIKDNINPWQYLEFNI